MVSRFKLGILCIALLVTVWVGWNAYGYFFSKNPPEVTIDGIEQDGCYAGDAQCILRGKDAYKIAHISLYLDGKPLVEKSKISKREFKNNITIPTNTLANGNHVLQITAENGTFTQASITKEIQFAVDNLPLQAAFVKGDTDAKVFQGRTLHVQVQANKELKEACAKTLSKTYPCFQESPQSFIYECYIPIECDQISNEYVLTLELQDKIGNKLALNSKFQVVAFPFTRQSLRIDPDKIKAENEAGLDEKQFEAAIEILTHKSPQKKLWQGLFIAPTEIREQRQITTQFGVMRMTQERGLKQHKAIDIYNTPKSVIWAPQDGIIVLKDRYAHSGNTIVIDHGCSILTLLFHLDSFASVEVGDIIKRGNPLGYLGKTGYATGYHLHCEMRINNIAIDPLQWFKHDF